MAILEQGAKPPERLTAKSINYRPSITFLATLNEPYSVVRSITYPSTRRSKKNTRARRSVISLWPTARTPVTQGNKIVWTEERFAAVLSTSCLQEPARTVIQQTALLTWYSREKQAEAGREVAKAHTLAFHILPHNEVPYNNHYPKLIFQPQSNGPQIFVDFATLCCSLFF